jgi:mRNA-degrading endonuclease RelE of RelBE toxin-antitoxin system
MAEIQLIEKVKKLPAAYQKEVEDFVDFILEKKINIEKVEKKRTLGLLKGKMKMSPDFDAPLEDFKDYM